MNSKGIRLEVKPWLYRLLLERQDMLRNKTGRKTSLAEILMEYCLKGIKLYKTEIFLPKNVLNESDSVQNQEKNTQNRHQKAVHKGNSVQNKDETVQNSVQNEQQNVQNNFVEDQLKLLDYKEKQLNSREKRLIAREKLLFQKESVQNRKSVQFFVQMEELFKQKTEVLNNFVENAVNKHDLKQNETELKTKGKTIKVLEDKLAKRDDDIVEVLNGIDKNNKDAKKGEGFSIEKILPYVAPIISIVGFLLLNKKIDNTKDLGSLQDEVINILKNLDKPDKKTSKDSMKRKTGKEP